MVSSTGHSGSGTWEFIGSAGPFRKDGGPRPAFYIYGDVELAAPALSFGTVAPAPEKTSLSALYIIMWRLIGHTVYGCIRCVYRAVVPSLEYQ